MAGDAHDVWEIVRWANRTIRLLDPNYIGPEPEDAFVFSIDTANKMRKSLVALLATFVRVESQVRAHWGLTGGGSQVVRIL